MNGGGRRALARALAGALGCLVCLALASPADAASPSPSPTPSRGGASSAPSASSSPVTVEPSGLPVEVSITALSPVVVRPGQDVHVNATVRNSGTETLTQPSVVAHLARRGFVSRTSLDVWRTAAPGASLGTTVASIDVPGPLAPGQSASVSLTVPAASLGLPSAATSWGARGFGLEVVDRAAAARGRQGVARTFLVWYPADVATHTSLSVLVPIAGDAPGPDASAQVGALVGPGGRLDAVLDATAAAGLVTWAVDPWLVEAAASGVNDGGLGVGADDDTAGDPTGPIAPTWAAGLVAAAAQHEVLLLPWADADVPALAHADAEDLLAEAADRSKAAAAAIGLDATGPVVLAGSEEPDRATAAAARGLRAPFVVAPGDLPSPAELTFTTTGRADVRVSGGTTQVLVPDQRLSRALTTGHVLETDPAVPTTGVTAAADVLAELAVVTRERPNLPRTLLATAPRDWQPDVATVRTTLAALADAPFVDTTGVEDLAATSDPGFDRGALPATAPEAGEVSRAVLDAQAEAVARRVALAGMLMDPTAELGDTQAERLAVTSRAWRTDAAGRRAVVAAMADRADALSRGVEVAESRDVNLLSSSGMLPLQIANHLDQEVRLTVRLAPSDARLVAKDGVDVVVPPGGEVTAQLPVHGVQSADVPTTVQLLTPDGALVDDSTTLLVRVRAEWESIGTAIATGLVALGFVVGLVRTIRRGRGRNRLAPNSVPPGAAGSEPEPAPEPASETAPEPASERASEPTP